MTDLVTKDDALGIAFIGIGVPVVLSVAGQVPNGALASAIAAAFLMLLATAAVPIVGSDSATVEYAIIPARLFALTALGEAAFMMQKRCTRRIAARDEMRVYECTALLVCAFLVIGQIMDALSAVLPEEADTGTFLGIVIAGLSFSLRHLASCLVAGLHENIAPRYHSGDQLVIRGKKCTVARKTLYNIDAYDEKGCLWCIPHSLIAQDGLVVAESKNVNGKIPRKS
jgi:hypothetical protein